MKREGYPNVQAFQRVYNKAEALIMEYNEELRAWKNQTDQKRENPLEQPKKTSVLEKLHRYQHEGKSIFGTGFGGSLNLKITSCKKSFAPRII